MNYDEFAFFNRQLAAMLRDGLPLEGALKQLCAGLKDQALHAELTLLEADLAQGTPLKDALHGSDCGRIVIQPLQRPRLSSPSKSSPT